MNLQCVALLTAAFALGRADLMQLATRDRLHQPYRAEICPLLPALLPLAGHHGVMSITLSGAGPAVMLLTQEGQQEGHHGDTAGGDPSACRPRLPGRNPARWSQPRGNRDASCTDYEIVT